VNGTLGYEEIRVPDRAFAAELTWDEMLGLVDRLGSRAQALGRVFGGKLTNTLVVENREGFLPAEQPEMYLSGPPLHVLAIQVVRRFRRLFGDRFPISFSGGVDRVNFPDVVALGLAPVTVCTDMLKPGGYGRARAYLQNLLEAMNAAGAQTIQEFVLRASGDGTQDPRAPTLHNAEAYADELIADPRYTYAQNCRPPKSIESSLWLFDCVACDRCVPACPNDANFTFAMPAGAIPVVKVRWEHGTWRWSEEGIVRIGAPHQIAHFADFCNDCGNCDVFCPEHGDPHLLKPRVFGSYETWSREPKTDGFLFTRDGRGDIIHGRFAGDEYTVRISDGIVHYTGPGFDVTFAEADPEGTFEGEASGVVMLTCFQIMSALGKALLATTRVNYVNALVP
jgi:putative selenate reductase